MTKGASLRADFERATARLAEALALPKDAIVRDSAIQRFEISFELCWKFLKAYLEEEHMFRAPRRAHAFAPPSRTVSSPMTLFGSI
jgi:hypothetical protein